MQAGSEGGAISLKEDATLGGATTLVVERGSAFSDNSAGDLGGVVFAKGALVLAHGGSSMTGGFGRKRQKRMHAFLTAAVRDDWPSGHGPI